jgi:hypothetical protein
MHRVEAEDPRSAPDEHLAAERDVERRDDRATVGEDPGAAGNLDQDLRDPRVESEPAPVISPQCGRRSGDVDPGLRTDARGLPGCRHDPALLGNHVRAPWELSARSERPRVARPTCPIPGQSAPASRGIVRIVRATRATA